MRGRLAGDFELDSIATVPLLLGSRGIGCESGVNTTRLPASYIVVRTPLVAVGERE